LPVAIGCGAWAPARAVGEPKHDVTARTLKTFAAASAPPGCVDERSHLS